MRKIPVVMICNTSDDTTTMLRIVFEQAGFVAVSFLSKDVRAGRLDLAAFCRLHEPDVCVYDIGLPYEPNWRLFCHLRARDGFAKLPVIITTTNVKHVQPLAGAETVHEIVGKPYDLSELISMAKMAIRPAHTA